MITNVLRNYCRTGAVGPMILRAGIVGMNFLVMLALAAHLGLADFGALIYLWGAAMVAGTLLSCGGPLILLRELGDGYGGSLKAIVALVIIYPAFLGWAAFFVLQSVWPDPRWAVILIAGFCINAVGATASIMRALGSVQMSMALRDTGPVLALGLSVFLPIETLEAKVIGAAGLMAVMVLVAAIWCILRRQRLAEEQVQRRWFWSSSLWTTSVLGMLLAQVDILIGGAFMDAEALGLYALLRRIANVVALPVSVATWVSAGPVAAAFGAGDMTALRHASAAGSRIAWFPACAITLGCLGGVIVAVAAPWSAVTPVVAASFTILLAGALVQAFYASGMTVATLTNHASLAAMSRALTILIYLVIVVIIGGTVSPAVNALAYVVAICLGSFVVWWVLWRDLGVDTSARVLWPQKGAGWKTS